MNKLALSVAVAFMAVGCKHTKHKRADFGPHFYSKLGDRIVCSKGVDAVHEWKHETLAASLEYAREHGVVLQTFGHAPTINLSEYFPDFDWAYAHGVPMVTWRELPGHIGPGWAFTIDDDEVDTWYTWRESLRAHHVHVTFFVSSFARMTPDQRRKLHEPVADGHDVEAHSATHADSRAYVKERGLASYIHDEVLPSQALLAGDGFPTPIAFAYPYGDHDPAIDDALLPHFLMIRTTGGKRCVPAVRSAASR